MIVDRYDPMNLFELVPKLKLQMEPEEAQGRSSYQGELDGLDELDVADLLRR